MINQFLLVELEDLLGKSVKTSKENYAFSCPFCNQSKKKLEIDLGTSSIGENRFACWVCGAKGRTIKSLLYRMGVSKSKRYSILQYVKSSTSKASNKLYEEILTLPSEYTPLANISNTNYIGQKAKKYLYSRGLSDFDILKYKIGYCGSGEYEGRIIIPSYDSKNSLAFYIGRSFESNFFKYKNPSRPKEGLVFFENTINWDLPITLVEGVFDAISVKRNAIPILGKSLPTSVFEKLIINGVKKVYVMLDNDAMREALNIATKLMYAGISTHLLDLPKKDPAEMSLSEILSLQNIAQPLNEGMLIKRKLNL